MNESSLLWCKSWQKSTLLPVQSYYRDDKTIKKFGERLREIRQAKGISQEQLAHACGFEYSQINRIELGEVNTSISHVALLAHHLEVSPCKLLEP